MEIHGKRYKLTDFIKIPMMVAPIYTIMRIFDKLMNALIPSIQVLATARFVDTALDIFSNDGDVSQIYRPLFILVIITAYSYISWTLMTIVKTKLNMKLTEEFRVAVVEKRAKLEYRHIENNETWELITRACDDPTGRISGGFDILLRMADMIVKVASILLILITQVWWAALAIISFSVPLFYISIKSGKSNYEAFKEAKKYQRKADYLQSILTGRDNIEERTMFSYTDDINKKWYEKFETSRLINMKVQAKNFVRMKGASLITVVISILISGVLIFPLSSGAITVGMFMGLVTATFNLVQMMSWELSYVTSEIAKNREYLKDLSLFSELSETDGALDMPDGEIQKVKDKSIEFIDVSFKYPDTEKYILKNLSMKLEPYMHYAFVGINGAGKTTITKLLTGMYNNFEGEILIGGKSIREYGISELKGLFCVVYQDHAKYYIPLRDNIALGNVLQMSYNGIKTSQMSNSMVDSMSDNMIDSKIDSMSDYELPISDSKLNDKPNDKFNDKLNGKISEAIRTIELEEVVEKLPDGIDTPLGKIRENGVDISGGEWQRVAIARALVSNAPIHILDEPTAALDPVAESRIYEMFGRVSAGKSTIFITHRLGAAKLADEILVINEGCVTEKGSHNELMAKGGIYADMFESQRSWYN